jgi:hypothetical protein
MSSGKLPNCRLVRSGPRRAGGNAGIQGGIEEACRLKSARAHATLATSPATFIANQIFATVLIENNLFFRKRTTVRNRAKG